MGISGNRVVNNSVSHVKVQKQVFDRCFTRYRVPINIVYGNDPTQLIEKYSQINK